jgi:hypothetical protein
MFQTANDLTTVQCGATKGTICAINGPNCESKGVPLQPSEVHGDHIIARSRFKNPKDADRLVEPGRNYPSLYTVNGRPLYVHLNGLAIVLLK